MITRGVRLLLVVDDLESVLGVITANERVEVIELAEVERARVGHVLETLRRAGRQHALVVERAMVRGIFSISPLS
jgi:hypothetical protein